MKMFLNHPSKRARWDAEATKCPFLLKHWAFCDVRKFCFQNRLIFALSNNSSR